MKNHFANTIPFCLILIILGIINLLTPDKVVSEIENRNLEQMPVFSMNEMFKGEYFQKLDLYFSDQFAFREDFVLINGIMKEFRGIQTNGNAEIVVYNGNNTFEEQIPAQDVLDQDKKDDADFQNMDNDAETTQSLESMPMESSDSSSIPETSSPADSSETPPTTIESTESTPESTSSISTEPSTDTTDSDNPVAETTKQEANGDEGLYLGKILIWNNSAYSIFTFNEKSADYYSQTLKTFKAKVGDSVKVYSFIAPTSIEFIAGSKYKTLSDSEKDAIDYIHEQLGEGITTIDAYTPLSEHRDEYVYFRTDHHWTALGAYYAYTGFENAIGLEHISLSNYESKKIEPYLGATYRSTNSIALKNHPDSFIFYQPYLTTEYYVYYEGSVKLNVLDMTHAENNNKYGIFLSGDRPLGKIMTPIKNGKKILIVKDSFANALVPFLIPHYEEIYILDPRQYQKNIYKLIDENGIQEVMFLNNAMILGGNGFMDLVNKVMDAP